MEILLSKDMEQYFFELYATYGIVSSKDIFDLDDELIGKYIEEYYKHFYPDFHLQRDCKEKVEFYYNGSKFYPLKLVRYMKKICL